ncbi:tol-pal system protein YbgF [Chthonobacter rhizosphaerae]|uniref:tol-pal system protein YbgF n=1 Tax=Chthonobacter rhizosphaerae TaxID=2735553 RepID=UPI0015EF11E1|nr:tol-pal system protein YbgF [Chthonobacter rhizosphaerae]
MIMDVKGAIARHGLPVAVALLLVTATAGGAAAQMFGRSPPTPPAAIGGTATEAQSSAIYAEQSMRIDQMQEQMRQLNGRVEELTYQIQQLQELMRRQQEDAEFRFQQLEGNGRPAQKRSDAATPAPSRDTAAVPTQPGFTATPPATADGSLTAGAPPAVLGTIPGDGSMTAPPSNSALGGPLDLSAIARGVEPSDTFGSPGLGTGSLGAGPAGDPTFGAPQPGALPGVATAPPAGGLGAPRPAPDVGTRTAAVMQPTDPRASYDQAYGYILSGDYQMAEMSLKQFLSDNPRSELASSAQFWLGESYYARDRFREAADAFLTTYRDYPKSPKAPESLLKLGLSLEGLGERDAACATYGELSRKFPSAPAALLDRASAQRTKAGC